MEVHKMLIDNNAETGASAFVFDLRNSSKIVRAESYGQNYRDVIYQIWEIHKKVYEVVHNCCTSDQFALNDTGDGYLGIFWDDKHAITCLRVAMEVKNYLEQNMSNLNKACLLSKDRFSYGLALHSGGCIVIRSSFRHNDRAIAKDFIFGILPNTVARIESLTKNYVKLNVLATGNFRKAFLLQDKSDRLRSVFIRSKYVRFLGRVNARDGKERGHMIYFLKNSFFKEFSRVFDSSRNSQSVLLESTLNYERNRYDLS